MKVKRRTRGRKEGKQERQTREKMNKKNCKDIVHLCEAETPEYFKIKALSWATSRYIMHHGCPFSLNNTNWRTLHFHLYFV